MKKSLRSLTIITIIIITIINIFDHSTAINQTIAFAFQLFINNVFPSLFPMFLISTMLVDIGIPEFLGNIFQNIMAKIFKTKGEASFVFFMSMITGFPSSAKYINDLMDKKLLNDKSASKILTFTFFSNPLFIINTVGIMFLNNKKLGLLILIAHILGNIIVGLIFRKFNRTAIINNHISLKKTSKDLINKINETNIFQVLLKGIKESLNTLIMIFGIITFFLIIINLINTNLINNKIIQTIFAGLLEMTTGLKNVSLLDIPIKSKALISMAFISFGGLSVHTQIMNILQTKKVKYLPFLIARIIHAFISVLILLLLIP